MVACRVSLTDAERAVTKARGELEERAASIDWGQAERLKLFSCLCQLYVYSFEGLGGCLELRLHPSNVLFYGIEAEFRTPIVHGSILRYRPGLTPRPEDCAVAGGLA